MEYTLKEFERCCSQDNSKLACPRFSVVFLQTFCIHDALQFVVPDSAVLQPDEYEAAMKAIGEKADRYAKEASHGKDEEGWIFESLAEFLCKQSAERPPIAYMYQDIEKQIFITSEDDDKEAVSLEYSHKGKEAWKAKKSVVPFSEDKEKAYTFSNSSVYRFSLKGFDFSVPIRSTKVPHVTLKGHANVEMSLFYGNTVSIAYKFYFDGYTASILKGDTQEKTVALTDHIISFLSCHLGAEYWSAKSEEESSIDLLKEFNVDRIWFDKNGKALPEDKPDSITWAESPDSCNYHDDGACSFHDGAENRTRCTFKKGQCPFNGEKRVFNNVMMRYKRYLYENCTAYKKNCTRREKKEHCSYRKLFPLSVSFDHHYAMVDIWGDVMHSALETKRDVFAENDVFKLSEPDIVTHIRDFHKPELIGLMTLYPSEWKFRDAEAFGHVCGESVAIDTDDLVLVGTHVATVIGTYDRRGEDSCGNNWKAMARVKAKHHVAWPEYLMILQFILAKKVVISRMKDRIIDITKKIAERSTSKLLYENANFSLDLTRQILQLDVVKYAKFASHRVMYDRTLERLDVDRDIAEIHDMSDMLNSNLQNISNYRSMKSDSSLNWILALISVVSVSELMYQDSKLDFWETLFSRQSDLEGTVSANTSIAAAVIILIIAAIGIIAIVWLIINAVVKWRNERK